MEQGPHIAILAGGESRRMGRDKARLDWRGQPLLAHMIALARAAGAVELVLCGPAARYAAWGVPCLEDELPDSGPLGAIAGALRRKESGCPLPLDQKASVAAARPTAPEATGAPPRVLILGCDMPLLPPEFLAWLWRLSGAAVAWTVPSLAPQRYEPLCAVYPRALLPVIEKALAAGERKVDRALRAAPCRLVSGEEIEAAGFSPRIFSNLNQPEDYRTAREERP